MSRCKITVLRKEYYPELARDYCRDPDPGPCSRFQVGQELILDWRSFMDGGLAGFCPEALRAVGHYIYSALQGGAIMKGWTKDERIMLACCNDGVRPVIFRIERIDD